jgi:DNA-binding NarL/FixJ family response regulator
MYKILFIDEEKEAHDDFRDYVDSLLITDVEICTMFPYNTIQETIDAIISENPDAVISDFELNEQKTDVPYNVPYNGVDLVTKFQSIRNDFPCFIMTAFDNQAVHSSNDVNIVYVKNILHNPEKGIITFLERVKEQIRHYKTRISEAETELQRLLELRNSGQATLEDEARLIELDSFLEKALNNKTVVPSKYKELSNTEHLVKMLTKADEIIKKLEDNK